ncbi:hypothetical protein PR202_ga15862 [Eleusine coracana subsp. coracana]|uniref:RING-CH-type domain-containing protein n=1 Tax=Eleusine coracana subsp. coracana TaxID=191504 RepID=A0AAV5CLD2_ELECO|nr:hypothetical protein PR202_ga15862 [Eleusine coracana subsp. coracana]
MKDHLMVNVDDLSVPEPAEVTGTFKNTASGPAIAQPSASVHTLLAVDKSMDSEEEPLLHMVECRICQEEDSIKNLESPCACTGSLKPYEHGYTAPPRAHPDETTIDISHISFFAVYSGGWTITGTAFDLRDPRILAVAQNHIMEAEYDDYSATNASTAAFCRSAALVLMALLLLRHALTLTDEDDDDTSAMFSLFLLRAAGFLLPFYIMAWAISILQRRRQRQEAAALAATEVAFILQSGQGRGVHFTIAPDSPATPQHEPQP